MEKNQQRLAQWQDRLHQWRTSGKSGLEWSKEQKIPYPTFCYWRTKFANLLSKQFVELADTPKTSQGFLLEGQGIAIRFSSDFNVNALKRLLQLLKELSC